MDWIVLDQDRDRWWAVMKAVMNLLVSENAGFFLQLCNDWTCRVVRVLPHTKSAHTACNGWTCRVVRVLPHTTLRIQLVQNAHDDGLIRSETCRANISAE